MTTARSHIPYTGSGPYCYSNSFAMLFGSVAPPAPPVDLIEVLTGSPFGMQLIAGRLPFFDPYGWDPSEGFATVLDSLGWTSEVSSAGDADADADAAMARLERAVRTGPVWVGPVEMGELRHQPGMTGPIGADHYVVVLDVDGGRVLMHDPQGFPYATLPVPDFVRAWRKEAVAYGEPFTMRTNFAKVKDVAPEDALTAALPVLAARLDMSTDTPMPPGTLGNGAAAARLADLVEAGPGEELRGHLVHFAVRVGARRLSDASMWLRRIGRDEAGAVAAEQARLVGALQHPLVTGDDAAAAAGLRELAPLYERLRAALPPRDRHTLPVPSPA